VITRFDPSGLRLVAQQRSRLSGFVDTIAVEVLPLADGHSSSAAYSRSETGYWDLGVNTARLEAWIRAAVDRLGPAAGRGRSEPERTAIAGGTGPSRCRGCRARGKNATSRDLRSRDPDGLASSSPKNRDPGTVGVAAGRVVVAARFRPLGPPVTTRLGTERTAVVQDGHEAGRFTIEADRLHFAWRPGRSRLVRGAARLDRSRGDYRSTPGRRSGSISRGRTRSARPSPKKLDAEIIGKDNRCRLGQWLYGRGRARYGPRLEFEAEVDNSRPFRVQAGELALRIDRGRDERVARPSADERPFPLAWRTVGAGIIRCRGARPKAGTRPVVAARGASRHALRGGSVRPTAVSGEPCVGPRRARSIASGRDRGAAFRMSRPHDIRLVSTFR